MNYKLHSSQAVVEAYIMYLVLLLVTAFSTIGCTNTTHDQLYIDENAVVVLSKIVWWIGFITTCLLVLLVGVGIGYCGVRGVIFLLGLTKAKCPEQEVVPMYNTFDLFIQ